MSKYRPSLVESIAKIVREVLVGMDMYSTEAFDLVMRTGMVESGYQDIEQQPKGPAIGFWQVELGTANSLWYDMLVYRAELRNKVYAVTGIDKRVESGPFKPFNILSNIALQAVLCRLKYRTDPEPIPTSLEEQAEYWVRVYNAGGKGSVEKFLKAVKRFEDG
jgi:hypothetical protein